METRERVLQAALECFTELGYDRTSIAEIRNRSDVSNGALFHHFPSKKAIAEALYLDAMRSVQSGYWAVLEGEPATVRDGIDGLIRTMLAWVEANPPWARFLYAEDHLDWSTSAGSELQSLNRKLAAAYRTWLRKFVAAGTVRDLPTDVVVAIVTGPAHAIARRWLAGQVTDPLQAYADDLIDAAVAGIGGTPAPQPEARRRQPVEGHIHVRLLGEDGTTVAEGHAVAALTPVIDPPAGR